MKKIIFAGPVGAGKTTAIESVTDTPIVKTDALATDEAAQIKRRTTVALDYGTLNVTPDLTIQLIGTPGQDRFSFMWDILSVGALGVVLLVCKDREHPLSDLEKYLDSFSNILNRRDTRAVVGITHSDVTGQPQIDDFRNVVRQRKLRCPVFDIDARKRKDVKVALLALMAELNPIPSRRSLS